MNEDVLNELEKCEMWKKYYEKEYRRWRNIAVLSLTIIGYEIGFVVTWLLISKVL